MYISDFNSSYSIFIYNIYMKRTKLTITFLLFSICLFAGVEKQNLSKLIPYTPNTDLVVELDINSLLNKSQVLDNSTKEGNLLSFLDLSKSSSAIIASLLDSKGPLDYTSKAYFILFNDLKSDNAVSLHIAVKNYKQLVELIDELKPTVIQSSDYKIINLRANMFILFNKEQFILTDNIDKASDTFKSLLFPENTLHKSEFKKEINKKKNDIVILANNLDKLPLNKSKLPFLKFGLEQKHLANIQYIININFEQGKLNVQSELSCKDRQTQKALEEFSYSNRVKNKLINYISPDSKFVGYGAPNKKQISKILEMDISKPYKSILEDLASILEKTQGDIAIVLEDVSLNGFLPSVNFNTLIQTDDKGILKSIEELFIKYNIQSKIITNNLYSAVIGNVFTIYYGIEKDLAFITTSQSFAKRPLKKNPNIKSSRYYKGKQNFGFLVLDVNEITNIPFVADMLHQKLNKREIEVVKNLDYIKIEQQSPFKSNIDISFIDKNTNSLFYIIHKIIDVK